MKRTLQRKKAFTLVELLVVIAIMGLLMALVLPAFTGIGASAGMSSAIADVRATLSLARQWAITHRTDTYVLFPSTNLDYTSTSARQHVSKANRAYIVYSEKEGYIGEWKYLPPGIVFDSTRTNTSSVFNPNIGGFDFPFPSSTSQEVTMVRFAPAGGTKQSSGSGYGVYLKEGSITVNTNTGAISQYILQSGKPLNVVKISDLIGAIKVYRY